MNKSYILYNNILVEITRKNKNENIVKLALMAT